MEKRWGKVGGGGCRLMQIDGGDTDPSSAHCRTATAAPYTPTPCAALSQPIPTQPVRTADQIPEIRIYARGSVCPSASSGSRFPRLPRSSPLRPSTRPLSRSDAASAGPSAVARHPGPRLQAPRQRGQIKIIHWDAMRSPPARNTGAEERTGRGRGGGENSRRKRNG